MFRAQRQGADIGRRSAAAGDLVRAQARPAPKSAALVDAVHKAHSIQGTLRPSSIVPLSKQGVGLAVGQEKASASLLKPPGAAEADSTAHQSAPSQRHTLPDLW